MVGRSYIKDNVNGKCMALHRWKSDDRMIALQITSAEKQTDLPHYLTIYCVFMLPSLRMTMWWRSSTRMECCRLSW